MHSEALLLLFLFQVIAGETAASCIEDVVPVLNGYKDKLDDKCLSDPPPVITPAQLVPVLDYFIDYLINKTPKALLGKLPEGSAEILVKSKSVVEPLTDVNLCEDSGIQKVKEALMPQVADNLMPMKLSFNRNCPAYRIWLKTGAGKSFVSGLNSVLDKVFVTDKSPV